MSSNDHAFLEKVQEQIDSCIQLLKEYEDSEKDIWKKRHALQRLQICKEAVKYKKSLESDVQSEILKNITTLIRLIEDDDKQHVTSVNYTARRHSDGHVGAPKYNITKDELEFLLVYTEMPREQITKLLKISPSTLKRRVRDFNIKMYSEITDGVLDEAVKRFPERKQNCGLNSVYAWLQKEGMKVQKRRVRESMLRVDPNGVLSRSIQATSKGIRRSVLFEIHCSEATETGSSTECG